MLAGLSARSYGRFADSVTRIAAGRVERGLPHALRRCGYKTFSLYPWMGNFLGARSFQTSTGIEHFLDASISARSSPARQLLLRRRVRLIERERGTAPLFVFVYTMANHFPWDPLSARSRAGMARSRQRRRDRRISAPATYERARLRAIRRPARARISGRGVPAGAVRRSSAGFARQIVDPALDEAAIAQRIAHSTRATSPPITRSTP